MTRRSFLAGALVILAVGALLRTVWLTADPPSRPTVGVVWHDEGAWVHSARNRVLWGAWRTDNWNPVFLAPVFTALEYAAFRAFGVGTWQARTVPVASGLVALGFLIAGMNAAAGRRAALVAGALLATNYVFAMWNRAALMESTMTSLIVVSWAAYALAQRRPAWAPVAGIAAVLAFFTKASAAFFVAALVIEAVTAFALAKRRAPMWALAGLAAAGVVIAVLFVRPYFSEYSFYTWQMSVVRKPDYSIRALVDRASWLPIVQPFFTWMWPVMAAASVSIVGLASRWRSATPAERLLVLWVVMGLLELIVHDSGNERRYVMFMPALVALAAVRLAGTRPATVPEPAPAPASASHGRWLAMPLVLGLGYLVAGSALRIGFLDDIHLNHFHAVVRLSATVAVIVAGLVLVWWRALVDWLRQGQIPGMIGAAAIVVTVAGDLGHFSRWATDRQTLNYQASVAIGRLLAPGALVHGKLANGLALENQIRPVFIGHAFGNYEDRLQRDDVRYILTYVSPSVGFESQRDSDMIQEILDRYPQRRTVATFAVNETGGPDRAALIEKVPGSDPRAPD